MVGRAWEGLGFGAVGRVAVWEESEGGHEPEKNTAGRRVPWEFPATSGDPSRGEFSPQLPPSPAHLSLVVRELGAQMPDFTCVAFFFPGIVVRLSMHSWLAGTVLLGEASAQLLLCTHPLQAAAQSLPFAAQRPRSCRPPSPPLSPSPLLPPPAWLLCPSVGLSFLTPAPS